MGLNVKRWIEVDRAPDKPDVVSGRNYTPAGVDVYTTDDPALVRLGSLYGWSLRVEDLFSALDELEIYESRRRLSGEKIEIQLQTVVPEEEKGDVFHSPGYVVARCSEDQRGLVCLAVYTSSGGITLTALRVKLRRALEDMVALSQLEVQDRERYGAVLAAVGGATA